MKKMTLNILYCNECIWLIPSESYRVPFYSLSDGQPHSLCGKLPGSMLGTSHLLPNRFTNYHIEIPEWCPLEEVEELVLDKNNND